MSAVYKKSGDGIWTVGWYVPPYEPQFGWAWEAESDHSSAEEAARRCNWLNGGTGQPFPSLSPLPALKVKMRTR